MLMFERAVWRTSGSEDQAASRQQHPGDDGSREALTRAQIKALARCEPLSPAEFKARRRVAEQGLVSPVAMRNEPAQPRAR